MNKKKIVSILSWIFLLISLILILWKLFGSSPTELAIILPILLTILLKVWNVSDELKDHKADYKAFKEIVKASFANMKRDIKR